MRKTIPILMLALCLLALMPRLAFSFTTTFYI